MFKKLLISSLIISSIILLTANYSYLDKKLTGFVTSTPSEKFTVERVIDGDTIVLNDSQHVRMLGINTPEKKEKYYSEAKQFTSQLENKTIALRYGKEKKDLYNRTLAYVYVEEENFNKKLVEKGFANFYFPSGKDRYFNEFYLAWENCLKANKNLCEKSSQKEAECVKLNSLEYETQTATFENACDYSFSVDGWQIKDEGRKEFVLPNFVVKPKSKFSVIISKDENVQNSEDKIFWKRKDYVWTKSGDTLFLRDNYGKLVLWYNY